MHAKVLLLFPVVAALCAPACAQLRQPGPVNAIAATAVPAWITQAQAQTQSGATLAPSDLKPDPKVSGSPFAPSDGPDAARHTGVEFPVAQQLRLRLEYDDSGLLPRLLNGDRAKLELTGVRLFYTF